MADAKALVSLSECQVYGMVCKRREAHRNIDVTRDLMLRGALVYATSSPVIDTKISDLAESEVVQ